METKTLGSKIAHLRKENKMTQAQLAEKLGVTDKAVSKWERDLSCPDISLLPLLSDILGTTVDGLLYEAQSPVKKAFISPMFSLILNAVAIAMGVSTAVLTLLGQVDHSSALTMLAIGLTCLGIKQLQR